MHITALRYARLFFESYCTDMPSALVLDIGSQDVNGSIRDVCPNHFVFQGIDFVPGKGVDIVLQDPYVLPFDTDTAEIITCSSCFEHSEFFWLLFLEMVRCLKPEGVLYLNVPSNGTFHQYPVDCWRFYPDAGRALCAWARRNGYSLSLHESFIGERSADGLQQGGAWHDFVAVFRKTESLPEMTRRIVDSAHSFTNAYLQPDIALHKPARLSPDHAALAEQTDLLTAAKAEHAALVAELAAISGSRSWRLTRPLRAMGRFLRQSETLQRANDVLKSLSLLSSSLPPTLSRHMVTWLDTHPMFRRRCKALLEHIGADSIVRRLKRSLLATTAGENLRDRYSSYPLWSRDFDTPDEAAWSRLETTSASRHDQALVLVFFDHASVSFANETAQHLIASRGQVWKAVFLFSGEETPELEVIRQAVALDARITCNHLPLFHDSDLLVVLQAGALPRPHALRCFADALSATEHVLAYCDEDLWVDGEGTNPWLKPEFSPLLALQGVLLGKMVALCLQPQQQVRLITSLISGAFKPGEMLLEQALSCPQGVLHIPHVLFHDAMPTAPLPLKLPELSDPEPTVSIIIPTRDGWHLLDPCLRSLKTTDWPSHQLEILVVDNGSTDPVTLDGLEQAQAHGFIRVLRDSSPFNWSRLNNMAVKEAKGEVLVFLNNDTEVIDPAWLRILNRYLALPNTGAVGCKLLYPDQTVQHGGVVAGVQGLAGHAHLFLPKDDEGYCRLSLLSHEVSAVTGACLAVARGNFEAIGGFNEQFRVAFNDTVFCFDLARRGKRNVYVADALFVHHESKTRGYDDTPEKVALLQQEAAQAWSLHPETLRDDPCYSPNLSLLEPYELSFAPRRKPIWSDPSAPPRVMILSETHAMGHGVPVVLGLQAEALRARGYEVVIGGPASSNEIPYPGCIREVLHDAVEAACVARKLGVDLVIAHTPFFYGIAGWAGAAMPIIAMDHGEPPAHLFSDAPRRRQVQKIKAFHMAMATAVVAISQSIRDENPGPVHAVLRNGNSHLCHWSDDALPRRQACRLKYGWENAFVVLNVCRFHAAERAYKGVDQFALVRKRFAQLAPPELWSRTVFVLAGKASGEDVRAMTAAGLFVEANVSSEELTDLYFAADAYANFSCWEGYNLGIGQALAAGLPTVSSDIPAHREFGIPTTNDPDEAAAELIRFGTGTSERTARLWPWDEPLNSLCDLVHDLIAMARRQV